MSVPSVPMKVPKIVFIVPYRNRPQHQAFFLKYFKKSILDESKWKDDYEIYFSHQCDNRTFNRGAMKNIGFLAIKEKYPHDYLTMTMVFNDVDTVPFDDIFDYKTSSKVVKHFYGFKYTLGGIVSFQGADFEAVNGFPNYWGWGMEDNVIQKRCEGRNLTIDRSNWFPIGHSNVLQLFEGINRIINRHDPWRSAHDAQGQNNGLNSISQLAFTIKPMTGHDRVFSIDVSSFMTGVSFHQADMTVYDLRDPPRRIIRPSSSPSVPLLKRNNYWNEPSNPHASYALPKGINRFSPEYARLIGHQPKATTSATIRLGGVY